MIFAYFIFKKEKKKKNENITFAKVILNSKIPRGITENNKNRLYRGCIPQSQAGGTEERTFIS